MLTIDRLKEFGANVEEGLRRCCGDETFYLGLVNQIVNDKSVDELKVALDNAYYEGAFEVAHALKGMYGNLSLTPIYEPVCVITELLRAKTDMDYSEIYERIVKARQQLIDISR